MRSGSAGNCRQTGSGGSGTSARAHRSHGHTRVSGGGDHTARVYYTQLRLDYTTI